jgi:hypothetical protein
MWYVQLLTYRGGSRWLQRWRFRVASAITAACFALQYRLFWIMGTPF